MENKNNINKKVLTKKRRSIERLTSERISFLAILVMALSLIPMAACNHFPTNGEKEDNQVVVEVKAAHDHQTGEHTFVTDTEEVPSGWVTFRFINATEFAHFLFLDHLPGDKTIEDQINEIFPVFQESMYLIMEDKVDEAFANYGNAPAWSADIVYRGGPGFVSGGNTIETTMFLPPGNYVMECYVKSTDGTYHYTDGMAKGLVVTDKESAADEPTGADIRMSLTSEGFGIQGEMTPGKHKVAVSFDEAASGILGYDVHLARLEGNTEANEVALWMDGFRKPGLVSDHENPEPAEFLGGTHDMPVGNTAYFDVDLKPGRYMWVAEQPADASMYKEFTIPNN